jgi:hypothetical protein
MEKEPFSEIYVFPNPSEGRLTIEGMYNGNKLLSAGIYNVSGQLVLDAKLHGSSITHQDLDISNLEPGVYFLKLSDNQAERLYKIVKM